MTAVDALKRFDLDVIAAGHCTGWRATTALANESATSVRRRWWWGSG